MGSFSIGQAFGAGFGLVARRPLSVTVWGLVYSLINYLPFILLIAFMGKELMTVYGDLISASLAGEDPKAQMDGLMALSMKMQIINVLSYVTPIVSCAIINAAVFRAILRPSDGGFLGMKLGMDEVWQGLIYLCLVIILMIAAFVVMLIAAALGVAVWFLGQAAGSPAAGWIQALGFIILGVLAFGVLIWLALRLSLAGPVSFDRRGFELFESWTLTKGQSGQLFLLGLLLAIVGFVIQSILLVIFVALFIAGGSVQGLSPESIEAFFAQDPGVWMMQIAPIAAAILGISALLTGALYTIWLAPWASAYRQIVGEPAPAAAATEV